MVNSGEKTKDYRDLIVWQKSIDLVEEIYKLTSQLPQSEQYGISSQIQRAVVSIPSNIAEGSRRKSEKETKHFFLISFGSASEVETQIIILKRLTFSKDLDYSRIDSLLTEVLKMLNVMTR